MGSKARGNLGCSLVGNWVAVQDENQAAGYKMKQDGDNSSGGSQRNWAVELE